MSASDRAYFSTVAAEALRPITQVPDANHAIQVEVLEMSAVAATRVRASFGAIANADTAATVVAGGFIAAGGGSAPRMKAPVIGPPGVGLGYTSEDAVAQDVVCHYKIVRV